MNRSRRSSPARFGLVRALSTISLLSLSAPAFAQAAPVPPRHGKGHRHHDVVPTPADKAPPIMAPTVVALPAPSPSPTPLLPPAPASSPPLAAAGGATSPPPAAMPTGGGDTRSGVVELTTLRLLRDKGIITSAEYESAVRDMADSVGSRGAGEANTVVLGKWTTTLYGFIEADSIDDSTQSLNDIAGGSQSRVQERTPEARAACSSASAIHASAFD